MIIKIHRGATQIGGCITEIRTSRAKLIIDLGNNLPGSTSPDFTYDEITEIVKDADAIFYTHYHGDHIGFMSVVPEIIPQYIGAGAQDVMRCKYDALNKKGEYQHEVEAIERMRNYEAALSMTFNDIKVTPLYCSHSAFDAYMFKIECNGVVILHTGDYRGHGYMGRKLILMLEKYVGQVDVLITEGTMLNRNKETVKTEQQIQKDATEILSKHKYVFALGSSTDIDRMASFHAACKATNRHFYVDKYQNSVLKTFTNHTLASLYDFSNTEGYKGTTFELWDIRHIRKKSIVNNMKRRGFLMPVRSSGEYIIQAMKNIYTDEEPILLYSMWDGYWKGTEEQRIPGVIAIRAMFKPENIIQMHTSGHADVDTLADVCKTVNPRIAIIPIHKEINTDFCTIPIADVLKDKVVSSTTSIEGVTFEIA